MPTECPQSAQLNGNPGPSAIQVPVGGYQSTGRLGVLLPHVSMLPKWPPMERSACHWQPFCYRELASAISKGCVRQPKRQMPLMLADALAY